MTTLRRLKQEAIEACNFRGHKMKRFTNCKYGTGKMAFSHCSICNKEVVVNAKPLPNEIDIGGEAVALNCEN